MRRTRPFSPVASCRAASRGVTAVSANPVRSLPDVAHVAQPGLSGRLDWVGMGDIQAPVMVTGEDGEALRFPARVTAYVDLARPDLRGVHMSRLYLHVDQALSA